MKNLIFRQAGRVEMLPRLVLLLLVFALGAGLVFAPAAQAIRYLSDGTDDSTEGDPLDANDYGDIGGGIGGDIQDSFKSVHVGGGGVVVTLNQADARILLIVDFRGAVPVLQIVRIDGVTLPAEGPDVR